MPIPSYLTPLLALFAAHGERAYPVGGCVRDALRGVEPHDWDVAVTTPPEYTQELCEAAGYRVVPTGLRHGTVTVLAPLSGDPTDRGDYAPVECTTCRTEGGYTDGRHPDAVAFTGRIEDDLSRRDFTVNAMAFMLDPTAPAAPPAVLDLFGGREDLAAGLIRCVGDPATRFSEDALRMLRAVRFAVQLGFAIHPDTADAIRTLAPTLGRISRERIRVELQKILESPTPERGMSLLAETGLLATTLPGGSVPVAPGALDALPADFSLRLAALLWGLPEADMEGNLAALRLPTVTHRAIRQLATPRLLPTAPTPADARRLRHDMGELAAAALLVRRAHATAPAEHAALDELATLVRASEAAGDPVTLADLAVTGRDLLAVGHPAGPVLRETLDALLAAVLDDPARNTRATLLAEAARPAD